MKYWMLALLMGSSLEAKPHVHEQAKLMLALDESQKALDLVFELPAGDIFGFEAFRPARLKELDDKSMFLRENIEILEIPEACTQSLKAAKAFDIDLLKRPLQASSYESAHADLELKLRVDCKSSLLSKTLSLKWPSWLRRIKKVELTYLGSSKQDRKTLSPTSASFKLD